MKTFVIGDVHGSAKALQQVLERSSFNNETDTLISLGDIADGWSEVPECVDILLGIKNLIPIRGNHDVWCYDWMLRGDRPIMWTQQGGQATIDAYIRTGKISDREHKNFWKDQIDWYIDDQNRLFIHAGWAYKEFLGFEKEASLKVNAGSIARECHWDRSLIKNATAIPIFEKLGTPEYNTGIKSALNQFKEVYIGHTATYSHAPENYLNLWNMDSGCGWYGKLSIMDIDTKQIWQSDFSKDLYPNEKGRG